MCRWKIFENRPISLFGDDMITRTKVCGFLAALMRLASVCLSVVCCQ